MQMGELMRLARRLAILSATLVPLLLPAIASADNPGSGPTFGQLVFAHRVVAVVTVLAAAPDGTATIRYDRVYKGHVSGTEEYPADDKAVPLAAGERVLLLFNEDTLDFRGAYAQEISADGVIDVHGIPGAPGTLAELDAFFTLPASDAVSFGRVGEPANAPALVGVGLLLLGAAFGLKRVARPAR